MAAAAAGFIKPAFEIVCAPIARRINYAIKLRKNYKVLCDKASELFNKRHDINVEIDRQKLQKIPTKACEHWITKVGEVENKIEAIKQEFRVEKNCLRGLCPDIFARIRLGEQVVEMIGEIEDLEKSNIQEGFLTDLPPVKVEKKPVPASKLTSSSNHILEILLNKIRENNTPKIGIWGMGGVGKTTIMQLLNNTPEITTFDFVIWVTVSKSWSIEKLQQEVVQRLSIGITNESSDRVASKLLQVLEGKKYLLLLDDVWEMVDLSGVGFPDANEDNGCKVVLTTRELEVCRKMGTDIEINVAVLSEGEAWEMFYSTVGDVAMLPTIKPLAEEIVRECAGLPLAVKIVSSALRKVENVNVWRNFLTELKSPATSYIEDMNEKVFKPLKVSYDHLKGTEKNNCFLYCGLYQEDYKIKKSRLIGYWRAEGLLSSKLTLAEVRVKGEAILQALIDSSLLERCANDEYVKVHDLVRDLVLTMTSPKGDESRHLVRAGKSTEKMPEDEEWKKATRISFINHGFCNLPESPDCPLLLTLLLQGNDELEVIPESFFTKMPRLRLLDLSYTHIKSLPTSIANLVSLQALLLKRCHNLEALPEEVRALKGLEVLQVTEARMEHLPLWISELTTLKYLKFGPCTKSIGGVRSGVTGFMFPIGVMCRLSQMEAFSVSNLVEYSGPSDVTSVDIIAKELSSMTTLSSLEFDFGRVSNLQHFLQNSRSWREKRLTKFRFIVGRVNSKWRGGYKAAFGKYKRCLKYIGGEGSILPWAIQEVLSRSNCFVLEGHGKLRTLSELTFENVIDRNGIEPDAFPEVHSLVLKELWNLRCILGLELEGPPLAPSYLNNLFTNLRELELMLCPSIKKVFSSGFMVRQLSNLQVLSIKFCEGLEGMISEDEIVECGALPKLKLVTLKYLPEFDSFSKVFQCVGPHWRGFLSLIVQS